MTFVSHESQNIKLAVDAAIFTVINSKLHLLLIQMKKKPFAGEWAIPGGLIDNRERAEDAARRVLKTQSGVSDVYLEQLATFDDLKRDPIGRVVSIGYIALVDAGNVKLHTSDKYADVRFWPAAKLPKLAYDHDHVAKIAIDRLRAKLAYTNIAWSLLPAEFTLTELQDVYEAILGEGLDRRNFRKKFLSLGLLKSTGKKRSAGPSRPAELYRFKDHKLVTVDIL